MVSPECRRGLALLTAWLSIASIVTPGAAVAQDTWAGGFALETGYTWKLPRSWRISAGPATEIRPLYGERGGESAAAPPVLRNLDLNLAVTRRWLERWRFGTAARARARYPFSEEAAREWRTWAFAERFSDAGYVRWGHRFRTEQRFRGEVGEGLELTYRHRYRLGLERPLAGRSLDFGEWYFAVSAELLVSAERFAARPTAVDARPYLALGRNDVELGIEYREEHAVRAATDADDSIGRALLLVLQYAL